MLSYENVRMNNFFVLRQITAALASRLGWTPGPNPVGLRLLCSALPGAISVARATFPDGIRPSEKGLEYTISLKRSKMTIFSPPGGTPISGVFGQKGVIFANYGI
jgi:hypothetical protein